MTTKIKTTPLYEAIVCEKMSLQSISGVDIEALVALIDREYPNAGAKIRHISSGNLVRSREKNGSWSKNGSKD